MLLQLLLRDDANDCHRQVGVGCVERAALMCQLWSAARALLQAALQDRVVAARLQTAAEAATVVAVREHQQLQQRQDDERVALRAINERYAAKAEAAKQEYEQLKEQYDKVMTTAVTYPRCCSACCQRQWWWCVLSMWWWPGEDMLCGGQDQCEQASVSPSVRPS